MKPFPYKRIVVIGTTSSGKSTLARCVLRLIDPDSGDIFWGEDNIAAMAEAQLRPLRHRMQAHPVRNGAGGQLPYLLRLGAVRRIGHHHVRRQSS